MATTVQQTLDLASILEEPIDFRYKGFPPTDESVTIGNVGTRGWNVLAGDFLFPLMLIKERALDHNINLLARYCAERGLSLAPHGKTPMSPQIAQLQLSAGAWGITVATIHQARVMRHFGVQRILLANELVEPAGIRWVARELDAHDDFDFYCLVDSVEGVRALTDVLDSIGPSRRLPILVELGAAGGRAGCRTPDDAFSLAREVRASGHLLLAGVEAYEGAIGGSTLEERIANVDTLLHETRALTERMAAEGLFDGLDEIVVSAGGSLFFDRGAEILGPPWNEPVRTVIRSGTYITHDIDSYEEISPLAGRGSPAERLLPALEIWCVVLSTPEPGLAIAGIGKRDTSYDMKLPIPFALRREGHTEGIDGRITITALNDQHAFLRVDPGYDVRVGDLIGCGISHPCTAFDKWRLLPLVDDEYTVTGAIKTFF